MDVCNARGRKPRAPEHAVKLAEECSCGASIAIESNKGDFATYERTEIAAWRKRHERCFPYRPESWRVESIDDDGGCLIAEFSGPLAQERASEYQGLRGGEVVQVEAG